MEENMENEMETGMISWFTRITALEASSVLATCRFVCASFITWFQVLGSKGSNSNHEGVGLSFRV